MKALILSVAALAAFSIAAAASAQTTSPFMMATCDPNALTFSNVHLAQAVLANGTPLAAGDYQVRITTERPTPAVGQSPTAECWVTFVKNNSIVGREVATVVAAEDISTVAKGPAPKPNAVRVDLLKDGEYVRVWMNGAGTHYIVNLPVAR